MQRVQAMKIFKPRPKKPFELARKDAIVAAIAVVLVVIWLLVR